MKTTISVAVNGVTVMTADFDIALGAAIKAKVRKGLAESIGHTKGRKLPAAQQAILDAGLTPAQAAAICGTTRDILRHAWTKGKQFRPARPEWRRELAEHGVPESVWEIGK